MSESNLQIMYDVLTGIYPANLLKIVDYYKADVFGESITLKEIRLATNESTFDVLARECVIENPDTKKGIVVVYPKQQLHNRFPVICAIPVKLSETETEYREVYLQNGVYYFSKHFLCFVISEDGKTTFQTLVSSKESNPHFDTLVSLAIASVPGSHPVYQNVQRGDFKVVVSRQIHRSATDKEVEDRFKFPEELDD